MGHVCNFWFAVRASHHFWVHNANILKCVWALNTLKNQEGTASGSLLKRRCTTKVGARTGLLLFFPCFFWFPIQKSETHRKRSKTEPSRSNHVKRHSICKFSNVTHSFQVFPRAYRSASARSRTEAAEAWLTRRIDEVYRELTREPLDDTMEVGMSNQDESRWIKINQTA